jgi:hypothetical protein
MPLDRRGASDFTDVGEMMGSDGAERAKDRAPALLLVEQDDGIRRFLFWSLYVEGYKVLTARDASDARRLLRDVLGPIELLLMGGVPATATARCYVRNSNRSGRTCKRWM